MVAKQQKVNCTQMKRHVPESIHHSAASREEMCPKYLQPQTIFTLTVCMPLPSSTFQKNQLICGTHSVQIQYFRVAMLLLSYFMRVRIL